MHINLKPALYHGRSIVIVSNTETGYKRSFECSRTAIGNYINKFSVFTPLSCKKSDIHIFDSMEDLAEHVTLLSTLDNTIDFTNAIETLRLLKLIGT